MHSPLANQNQELRTNQLHRFQGSPFLEIYTTQRSKTEKAMRQIKREQIAFYSEMLKVGSDELMRLSLDEKIFTYKLKL